MSKTITIPGATGCRITVVLNGTRYIYTAGETATVPDEVAALLENNAGNNVIYGRSAAAPLAPADVPYDGKASAPVYADSNGNLRALLEDISDHRISIPTYSVEVDAESNVYKVRTFFPFLNDESCDTECCVAFGGTSKESDGKLCANIMYTTKRAVYGKKAVSTNLYRYWAKSWADTYDPETDGILTPENAPNSGSQQGSDQPDSSGVSGNVYVVSYTGSNVEGYRVSVRFKLHIIYDDGSTKDIWSSQINVVKTADGASVTYMHDTNSINEPTDIVAAGWEYIENKFPIPNLKGFYNGICSNYESIAEPDKYLQLPPEVFIKDDVPMSLGLFLVFGDGTKRIYGVLSNPGILTASAPDENEPGS